MKKPNRQDLTAFALEAAAYIEWVQARSEYPASNAMIDHFSTGLLEREEFTATPDAVQAIAVLAASLNPDIVQQFIADSGLFDDFDRLARKSRKNIL